MMSSESVLALCNLDRCHQRNNTLQMHWIANGMLDCELAVQRAVCGWFGLVRSSMWCRFSSIPFSGVDGIHIRYEVWSQGSVLQSVVTMDCMCKENSPA